MEKVRVLQIGLGSFGRYGFEKLVEMEKHLEKVDVSLEGVCDIDPEKLEKAEKFGDANDIEFRTFRSSREMYSYASELDGNVMIYDAGPSETHPEHLYDSIASGFFHLAEKPPSMNRDEHMKEKKLAEERDVMWKTDFIERENPVVMKALSILEGEDIDRIEVFRESAIGVQKLLDPVKRTGVRGGDVLDKMVHEVYVLDMLERAGKDLDLELQDAETDYFMPKDFEADNFMGVRGEPRKEIDQETATGKTRAEFSAGNTEVELNSSWLGVSERARIRAREAEDLAELIETDHRTLNGRAFLSEEDRFFIVEGSRNLLGDLLHEKLYDLDEREEIELPNPMHDQLYRVIEKAVLAAAGAENTEIDEKETDVMMNMLFDSIEEAVENAEGYYDELDTARERLKNLTVEEMDTMKPRKKKGLAG